MPGASFYVPDTDYAGAPVLDPVTGDDRAIAISAPTASAQWVPLDVRDRMPVDPPTDPATFVPVVATATGGAASITAKSITLRKSVAIVNDTGAFGVSPGDTLEYTLEINLSDYFAMGKTFFG